MKKTSSFLSTGLVCIFLSLSKIQGKALAQSDNSESNQIEVSAQGSVGVIFAGAARLFPDAAAGRFPGLPGRVFGPVQFTVWTCR